MNRLLIVWLLLSPLVLFDAGTDPTPGPTPPPGPGYHVKPTCTDSLQAQIDAAPAGGTVAVRADCIYREEVVIHTPLTLDGQGGAEIRGSDIWRDWRPSGGLWVSAHAVPVFPAHGDCESGSDGRCLWPEQVLVDGVQLRQVATGTTPGSGQFALDDARRVVLADDPLDAVVEVTVRERWVRVAADDTTVRGFRMRDAAVDAQNGAIDVQGVARWTVASNILSDVHGATVVFADATDGEIRDNEIFNAGQLGLGGSTGQRITVIGNSIHHNNTEDFSHEWEAGGLKITESKTIVIEQNDVDLNHGAGIWCDIDCSDVGIRDNRVSGNSAVGITFEISNGADIGGNRVWENGWGYAARTFIFEAGILISSSRNAEVHDNVVAWNGDGIGVLSQCRAYLDDGVTCHTAHRWNRVAGNHVHDNVVVMADDPIAPYNVYALGWLRDIVDEQGRPYDYMFTPGADNRGYADRYWVPQPEGSTKVIYGWGDQDYVSLAAFNATPGEEGGTYLSDSERDAILSQAGIPLQPADHSQVRVIPLPTTASP